MDFLAVSTTSCYFMEVNFSISLYFPEKKVGKKEKPRKTITTALPNKTPDYFGLVVKRF